MCSGLFAKVCHSLEVFGNFGAVWNLSKELGNAQNSPVLFRIVSHFWNCSELHKVLGIFRSCSDFLEIFQLFSKLFGIFRIV